MKIRITLMEELLGTASSDRSIHEQFIVVKGPNADAAEEELEALPEEESPVKGMTVFARNEDGKPIIWDYQIKGFFKDACAMLARVKGYKSHELKAYKKVIDGLIFPSPRKIVLNLPPKTKIEHCQRPLRAQTAQGERIALALAEAVPAGTWFDVEINCLDPKLEKFIIEWLDYGKLRGFGQWRNSGKGRFTWERLDKPSKEAEPEEEEEEAQNPQKLQKPKRAKKWGK